MKTKLLKPNDKSIELASKLLKQGEVVALPTETVYGLAGDSKNPSAIEKIFKAKGRPADNPLIVHISNMDMLKNIVSFIPPDAIKLAKKFWPGPLTMIMPKGSGVCSESCARLNSVGVRMPSHPVARKIIELSQTPFSAPSANISGKPSPTNAQDVFADMNGKIPLVIDGGESPAGVESTVLSLLTSTPTILRPGVVTKEDIEKVLKKPVCVANGVVEGVSEDQTVLSPGMKYKHYSPVADVYIVKGNFEEFKKYVEKTATSEDYAMVFSGEEGKIETKSISYGKLGDGKSQAHNLFSTLRKLDKLGAKKVFARCPDISGVSLAVYNRLIRSAGFKIINA